MAARQKRVESGLLDVRVARPSLVLGAMPLIARWYRRQQQQEGAALPPPSSELSASTRLRMISRTEDGARFLRESVAHFERAALEHDDPAEAAHSLGTAATLAWATGDLQRAHTNACGALSACRAAHDLDSLCEIRSLLARLERQMRASPPLHPAVSLAPLTVAEVERVDSGLSVLEFLRRYAVPRRPVILEGVGAEVVRGAPFRWCLAEWQRLLSGGEGLQRAAAERLRLAAARPVGLKRRVAHSGEWARLEDAPIAAGAGPTLGDVIARCGSGAPSDYLFDWSLPINCPELLEGVRVPRYFGNDLLQACAPAGSLYRETWPSLFLGPAGSSCGLHVDTFGSHFWTALLEGRKRWVFFEGGQAGCLGADYSLSADGCYAEQADAFVDALHATPVEQLVAEPASVEALGSPWARARGLRPMVCELRPGDALFVPAGTPHAVRNTAGPALSLSANYVDCTNLEAALAELELAALTDERALALMLHLRAARAQGPGEGGLAACGLGACEIGEHVPFAEFKRGDPSAGGRWPALDPAALRCEPARGEPTRVSPGECLQPRQPQVLPRRVAAKQTSSSDMAPFAFDPDDLSSDSD